MPLLHPNRLSSPNDQVRTDTVNSSIITRIYLARGGTFNAESFFDTCKVHDGWYRLVWAIHPMRDSVVVISQSFFQSRDEYAQPLLTSIFLWFHHRESHHLCWRMLRPYLMIYSRLHQIYLPSIQQRFRFIFHGFSVHIFDVLTDHSPDSVRSAS